MTVPSGVIVRPDSRGVPTTAASANAVALLDDAILGLVSHRADTPSRLARALETDPQLVVAHCLRGFAAKLLARRDLVTTAQDAHTEAQCSTETRGASERERLLLAALGCWCADDPLGALERLEHMLRLHPYDLLAIKLSHAVHFMMGQTAGMRRSVERVLPAWNDDVPGYAFVLGCHAFTLVETGELDAAERVGRAAFERECSDVWGAHAVVHAFELTDRTTQGEAWIADIDVDDVNNFAGHLQWHRALFLLAKGDAEGALHEYDASVATHLGRDYRDLGNASTFLWRLTREAVDVGARWQPVAEAARSRVGEHSLAFADVHYALALAGAGDFEAARALVASMYALDNARAGVEAVVLRECGAPLADAIVALAEGDASRAVALLLPLRDSWSCLGGSAPQRAVFEQILVEAALAADDHQVARLLLEERLSTRPNEAFSVARVSRVSRATVTDVRELAPSVARDARAVASHVKAAR